MWEGTAVTDKNLVPEVRVDRNGRPVTRHVRPENAAKSQRSIPSPDQNRAERKAKKLAQERLTEKMRRMLVKMVGLGIDVIGTPQAQHNVHHLIKSNPMLAQELMDHLRGGLTDTERDIWVHQLSFDELTPNDWRDDTDYSVVYRRAMELNRTAADIADQQPSPTTHTMHFARSLIYDTVNIADKYGRSEDMGWIKAAMLVIETYARTNDVHRRKVDISSLEEDINYIRERWDDAQNLIPEIIARNNATKEFVSELLESKAPALNSGLL